MQYGDWELRKNSSYYPAQNVILYPSSNSSDKGSLHVESNVRSIARRITNKSYKLHDNDFHVTLSADRMSVNVSSGEANIQGYHLIVNTSLSLAVPQSVAITPWTLGISLSYDAANNVTGDVVVYDKPIGENEFFSGAYLFFFDPCQLRNNYDNILVLGRIWEQNGKILEDGLNIKIPETMQDADTGNTITNPYGGYVITQGFEPDPFNDHRIKGNTVEVQIEGSSRTAYDTVQTIEVQNESNSELVSKNIYNIANMSKYGSMKYETEQDPSKYTKPPSITTDLQDFLNYMADWYTTKYGDYMTGALRFDQLSLDGKRFLDPDYAHYYTKDSSNPSYNKDPETYGKYHGTEGVFISPRTLGKLTKPNSLDWENGGTLMSVVPYTYENGLDYNEGDTAIYSALISQKNADTGMRIHAANGGRSKVVHNQGDDKLLIQNISGEENMSSVYMNNGQIFADSYNGTGIQIYSASQKSSQMNSVAFRFDEYAASVISHNYNKHRNKPASIKMFGTVDDTKHIEYGVSSAGSGISSIGPDPYMQIGNLRLKSVNPKLESASSDSKRKINTLEITNTNATETSADSSFPFTYFKSNSNDSTTYIKMLPGIYTSNALIPDYIQVGSRNDNDIIANDAITNTQNRILLYKHSRNDSNQNDGYTAIEQTYSKNAVNNDSAPQVFTKITPFTAEPTSANHTTTYREIGGIYSCGNIGASDAELAPYTGRDKDTGPYQDNNEWVRFTRFRYDKDQDKQYGGVNTDGVHTRTIGSTYNIEFNTNVRNRRANQIIWNYKGSSTTPCQPLTLSYIHDEYDSNEVNYKGTTYPNSTYLDHNLYQHQNPTFGVRDFLRIDGGGLSIHGDLNNPTLAGDESNTTTRFGMTLLHGRIYASVYNDYAETYEKANPSEQAIEGMVVMLDEDTGKYKICDEEQSSLVVGVISDNYGMLIGGKTIDGAKDHIESVKQINDFAVGVSGKVIVNVINNDVRPGDLLVSASKPGLAQAMKDKSKIVPGTVIGKVLSKATPVDGQDYYKCLMQIMLS